MLWSMPPDEPASPSHPPINLVEANTRLAPFLTLNPASSIEEIENPRGGKKAVAIIKPWGDDSIILFVPDDIEPFASALNNVFLPFRYTAIWHADSKDFEVIWTAFPIPNERADVTARAFTFRHGERDYSCEFRRSSDRLLAIATASQPSGGTATSHRNLASFAFYGHRAKSKDNEESPIPLGEPLSFWIRNVEWNDDAILDLATHLNFYMSYYDAITPTILIHSPPLKAAQTRTRFIIGRFPEKIIGREIDDNLLNLWGACLSTDVKGDAPRTFLYHYRIIEYVSWSFLDLEILSSVRRILGAPHALADVPTLTDQVVAAIHRSKLDEYGRFDHLLVEKVDPKLLWREISRNPDAFDRDTDFDGDFKLKALIAKGADEAAFMPQGVLNFARYIRSIRNALSHGKVHRPRFLGHRIEPYAAMSSV
jgi:hypothetical protein